MSEEEDLDEHVSPRGLCVKPPIGVRSQQQARRRVEERIRLQQLQEEAELAACSFSPRTLSTPRRRDFTEFLSEAQQKALSKDERLRRERAAADKKQAEEEASHSFHPHIGPMPPGMKLQKPVYLRDHATPRNLSADFQFTFSPTISDASKQLLRTQPIDSLLYKDALRRLSERKQPLQPSPPPQPKADKSLRRLFREEFDKACEGLPQCLSFSELKTLLERLYFPDEAFAKDIWRWLARGEQVSLPLIQQALCGVLGISKPSARPGESLIRGRLEGDCLHLNRKEIVSLHETYATQCQVRHMLRRSKGTTNPPAAPKRRHSADACSRLTSDAQKLRDKLEWKRREQAQKDFEQCSFHPKLRTPSQASPDATERLYAEGKERMERLKKKQVDKENSTEQYPFKPTLSPRLISAPSSPKGAALAAERLQRGRDQRILMERQQQQGFPYASSRPIATIRVNVRPEESGVIDVYAHSDLQKLVREFALAHCLPSQQEDRLLALVRKQLRK